MKEHSFNGFMECSRIMFGGKITVTTFTQHTGYESPTCFWHEAPKLKQVYIFIISSNIINSIRTTVFEHLPFTHYNCEAAYNTNEVLE